MAAADEYTQRLRDVFDLCDIDKRGYISIDHFVQLANEHFGTSGWDTENQEVCLFLLCSFFLYFFTWKPIFSYSADEKVMRYCHLIGKA